jgi:hypothetical protein
MAKPTLTYNDYLKAAKRLNCEVAVIRAVAEVESSGDGFDLFDNLKKRFEPNWFRRFTGKTVSSYNDAYAIDPINAMMATSWGKFQIMGFNHAICGFSSVENMVSAFSKGESSHLDAFVGFVISKSLSDELQRKNWKGFASRYNGPLYAENAYDVKMAKAYAKYLKDPSADLKKKVTVTQS